MSETPPTRTATPLSSAPRGAPLRALGRASGVLLGPPGHPRVRVSQALLSLVVYLLFAVVQESEVRLGLIAAAPSNWLTAFNLSGAVAFYALIRSGLNERFARDPSLTLEQTAFALCSVTWSYAITGPARGAVMSIMIFVISFSMFRLPARQVRLLALSGFLMLGTVMAVRGVLTPEAYDPRVELVHFVFAAVVLGGTATLAIRLGRLRQHLASQRAELKRALELNRILATRDSLTGLLNRRAMVELLAQEEPRQQRGSGPMTLAMVDIDWFKRINDQHGHHTGDAVLKRFAEMARIELRAGDALARWGGEEFLLMMPGSRREQARAALDRLSVRMAEGGFGDLAGGLHVSFSAGVAECDDGEAYTEAIERADRALYRAKQSGRNRIECV